MFEQVFNDIKEGYQKSWFGFIFKYTALGKLLEQDTRITSSTFFDTYFSAWWWNRLWFRDCIRQKDNLSQFDSIIQSFWRFAHSTVKCNF